MARTPRWGSDDEEARESEGRSPLEHGPDVTDETARRELPGGGGMPTDAGEYVLGTLDAAERERFEQLLDTDPEARRLAAEWRDRLGPLDDVVPPVAPSAAVWAAIEENLPEDAAPAANDNARGLRRSRNLWRGLALLAALVLAAIAVVAADPALRGEAERRLGLPGTAPQVVADGGSYLAVVNAEGALPAMILRVDGRTGRVTLRSLAVAEPEGRSLELWHIAKGGDGPVSLGLLDDAERARTVQARPGDTFAVSAEPEGGSPTGTATGPILYSGQLLPEPD